MSDDDLPDYSDDSLPRITTAERNRLDQEIQAEVAAEFAANQRQKNRYLGAELVSSFRLWAKYRGEPDDLSDEQIFDSYQVSPGEPVVPPPDPTNVPPRSIPYAIHDLDMLPRDAPSREFMRRHHDGLPGDARKWRGTKFLGQGTYGRVGLWEYCEPDSSLVNSQIINQVVVKESKVVDNVLHDLNLESEILTRLAQTDSIHYTKMLAAPDLVRPGEYAENPNDSWDGSVNRLYMEYCSMHDLYRLIEWRGTTRKKFFREKTLWRFLDCFADICLVLQFGKEAEEYGNRPKEPNPLETVYEGSNRTTSWRPIVHFDIKSENIFLSNNRDKHKSTPVLKIADFGLAEYVLQEGVDGIETQRLQWRNKGTEGWFTPEQFTERWNFSNWRESNIAGTYGPHSNIWGIGCLMYSLITCQIELDVDIKRPFRPTWELMGEVSKGNTYCIDLRTYTKDDPEGREPKYSNTLIHTVWECLYEDPAHRPTAIQLKERTFEAIKALSGDDDDDGDEPWADFEIPEGPGITDPITTPPGEDWGEDVGDDDPDIYDDDEWYDTDDDDSDADNGPDSGQAAMQTSPRGSVEEPLEVSEDSRTFLENNGGPGHGSNPYQAQSQQEMDGGGGNGNRSGSESSGEDEDPSGTPSEGDNPNEGIEGSPTAEGKSVESEYVDDASIEAQDGGIERSSHSEGDDVIKQIPDDDESGRFALSGGEHQVDTSPEADDDTLPESEDEINSSLIDDGDGRGSKLLSQSESGGNGRPSRNEEEKTEDRLPTAGDDRIRENSSIEESERVNTYVSDNESGGESENFDAPVSENRGSRHSSSAGSRRENTLASENGGTQQSSDKEDESGSPSVSEDSSGSESGRSGGTRPTGMPVDNTAANQGGESASGANSQDHDLVRANEDYDSSELSVLNSSGVVPVIFSDDEIEGEEEEGGHDGIGDRGNLESAPSTQDATERSRSFESTSSSDSSSSEDTQATASTISSTASDDFYARYPHLQGPPSDDDDSGNYTGTGAPRFARGGRRNNRAGVGNGQGALAPRQGTRRGTRNRRHEILMKDIRLELDMKTYLDRQMTAKEGKRKEEEVVARRKEEEERWSREEERVAKAVGSLNQLKRKRQQHEVEECMKRARTDDDAKAPITSYKHKWRLRKQQEQKQEALVRGASKELRSSRSQSTEFNEDMSIMVTEIESNSTKNPNLEPQYQRTTPWQR